MSRIYIYDVPSQADWDTNAVSFKTKFGIDEVTNGGIIDDPRIYSFPDNVIIYSMKPANHFWLVQVNESYSYTAALAWLA